MKSTPKSTPSATKRGKTTPAAPRAARPARQAAPPPPTRSEIASRAYKLYAQSGHQPGREVEFWLEAERQLLRRPKE